MAIKENLNAIKDEIGAQEQFLESVIKGERLLKKYKKLIITALVAILLGAVAMYAVSLFEQSRLKAANEAYSELITDPSNEKALEILKEKAPSLYALHQFKIFIKNGDMDAAKQLLNMPIDPLLKQILSAQIGDETGAIMGDYETLMRGYELLKQDKIAEADAEFKKIAIDSQLSGLVKNLQHYKGNK